VQLRRALNGAMEVTTAANQYMDARAPWVQVKQDRDHAAETLYVALNVVSALASLLNPILPFTSQQVWTLLAHDGEVQARGLASHARGRRHAAARTRAALQEAR
jgi:methionyl-tRNA synthetase